MAERLKGVEQGRSHSIRPLLLFASVLGINTAILACSSPNTQAITPSPQPRSEVKPITAEPKVTITVSPKPIKPTSTPEPAVIPELTPEQQIKIIDNRQQEALEQGELKLPSPEVVIRNGGTIVDNKVSKTGAGVLLVNNMAPETELAFPALVAGQVIEARKINAISNLVTIRVGDKNVSYRTPSSSILEVKVGTNVTHNDILFKVSYNPLSEIQQGFEKLGDGFPKSTIVVIGAYDPVTRIPDKLTFKGSMLKDKNGTIMILPDASSPK